MKEMLILLLLGLLGQKNDASTTDDQFLSSCLKYFHSSTPPTGFNSTSFKYICQRYEGAFYFATLYDVSRRIPVYSAYTIDELTCVGTQPSRRDEWFIEPELAGRDKAADMESDKKSIRDWVMPVQAINDDYQDSGFDRGHLNPNFHHCASSRVATFSLTNSVPQDPCFNRIAWYEHETETKENMEKFCTFQGAKRYVIVGAVPSANTTIPDKDILVDDRPDKPTERVNVPAYSWSLACCDATGTTNQSWWRGVIGENKAGGQMTEYTTITEMEMRLSVLYGYGTAIKLLAAGCGVESKIIANSVFG